MSTLTSLRGKPLLEMNINNKWQSLLIVICWITAPCTQHSFWSTQKASKAPTMTADERHEASRATAFLSVVIDLGPPRRTLEPEQSAKSWTEWEGHSRPFPATVNKSQKAAVSEGTHKVEIYRAKKSLWMAWIYLCGAWFHGKYRKILNKSVFLLLYCGSAIGGKRSHKDVDSYFSRIWRRTDGEGRGSLRSRRKCKKCLGLMMTYG